MADKELKEFNSAEIIDQKVDMKKLIDQLIAALRADKDVYDSLVSLKLTNKEVRDNIGKLADYQEDYNICKNCPGYDKCPKAERHISTYVYKDGSYLTTRCEPCKKYMEKMSLDSKYLFSDFPEEWKKSVLKELDLSENRRPLIKEFANIVKGNSKRWLFVTGNHKVGKSHLLVTFANYFVTSGLGQVAVVNSSKQFKELADKSFAEKDLFKKTIDILSNVSLLVIDDFGQEYKNEFIRDQIVLPILVERSHKDKPTFFSSEFTIKEIAKLYSVGKNGGEIRGKQLGNLLTDMCGEEFDLTGASIYKK